MTTSKHPLYLTIHGHFYQPPRENPWTGAIESQPSAAPDHDWNDRIARQCYSPNAASRILNPFGRISEVVNNYEYMSFNMGPTLLGWIRTHAPETYWRIQRADKASAERLGGHGNAIAQVYNHIIMPLADRRDRLTQIRWGIRDFEFHFGRKPEAMWLAETAINMDTVVDLIQEGIRFTILSPTQAQAFRSIGGSSWTDCSDTSIDTTRAYRIFPRDAHGQPLCEGHLDVFFYNPWLSSAVGFEHLLRNASTFGEKIASAFDKTKTAPQLISVATDGESYGHHEPFGDMCAAWLLKRYAPEHEMLPVNFGWYLEQFPPQHEATIKNAHGEGCAWSCAHGVGRWYKDCGCSTGGGSEWNQKWRGPLRDAFNHLKKVADRTYAIEAAKLCGTDPWEIRDRYIEVLLNPEKPGVRDAFLQSILQPESSTDDKAKLLRLLEAQKFVQFSFTSCGWFFNDIEGLEPVQNMRYALRAMELLKPYLPYGNPLESEFLSILARATSNEHKWNGAEIFVNYVRPEVPVWFKLMSEMAARRHLGLEGLVPMEESCLVSTSQHLALERASLFQLHLENPETKERLDAGVLVTTDRIGSITTAVIAGAEGYKAFTWPADPNLSPAQMQQLYPVAHVVRLRQLMPDSLRRINLLASQRHLKRLSEEFRGFALRYGLALDCLADSSHDLPASMRTSLALSLNIELQRLALEAMEHPDADHLIQTRALLDDALELKVKIDLGGLGQMFHTKLRNLIEQATTTLSEVQVRHVTSLITLADWLALDIDKTSLENQAYESYLLYLNSPKGEMRQLRAMFEWLNFDLKP